MTNQSVMRWLGILLTVVVLAGIARAQDTPVPPPTNTLAPIIAPTDTLTPAPPTATPTTPPPPTFTPPPDISSVLPDADRTSQILLTARNDIEILANSQLGAATRPVGWSGSFNISDPQMALLARLDLEALADELLIDGRPPGWFGVQGTSAYATARDIRHDLEALADVVVAPNVRPPNWMGDDPIMRCSRSTQALTQLLESRGLYTPVAVPGSPTYCRDLEAEISVYTESNLLDGTTGSGEQAAAEEAPAEGEAVSPNAPATIIDPIALAYYDRGASQIAGTIPEGTTVTPVARSYAQFSRMTLVRGEGFQLFVDYQATTLDLTAFEALGSIDVIDASTSCTPVWCVPQGAAPAATPNATQPGLPVVTPATPTPQP